MSRKLNFPRVAKVGCLSKSLLFIICTILLLCGSTFMGTCAERSALSTVSSITNLGSSDPVWFSIHLAGWVLFVAALAGWIGALMEITGLLHFFTITLSLLFYLQLSAGFLAFLYRGWITARLDLFFHRNMEAYGHDLDSQNLVDFTQRHWSCCGARGPDDWDLSVYFKCNSSSYRRGHCGVPFSCCVTGSVEDAINRPCSHHVRLLNTLEQQKYIYTRGCVGEVDQWLLIKLVTVSLIVLGTALLELLAICLTKNLLHGISPRSFSEP